MTGLTESRFNKKYPVINKLRITKKLLCIPMKAIKKPAAACPTTEATSQEAELMAAALERNCLGTILAIRAAKVGPENARIAPVIPMVPKIRNADNKSISYISNELKTVSDQCRNLKIDKKEFFGGSMTITSLGGIGGSFFTPIINYPEVAILGVGKSQKKQIFMDGKFKTRTMLPLSLSYDHRIIDGAEAARFNNDLKENLGKNFAYKLAI